MNEINRIARKYNLPVVEDAAQSIGLPSQQTNWIFR